MKQTTANTITLFGIFAAFFILFYTVSPFLFCYSQYQETFFYDRAFVLAQLLKIGGPACLAGLFVQQFCLSGVVSVALISAILTGLVVYTKKVLTDVCVDKRLAVASIIPVFALALYLFQYTENLYHLAAYFFLISALRIGKGRACVPVSLVLFYFAGEYAMVYALSVCLEKCFKREYIAAILPCAAVILAAAVSFYAGWLVPFKRMPLLVWISWMVVFATVCALARYAPKQNNTVTVFAVAAFVLFAGIATPQCTSIKNQTFKTLCHYSNTAQWDKILAVGRKEGSSHNQLFSNIYGYALAHKGSLPQRMARYGIIDKQSLIITADRKAPIEAVLSDVFFDCDCMAQAQRYAFEANQSFGGYSPKMLKTLVCTNRALGYQEVADKYSKLLGKTLFYRNWRPSGQHNIGSNNSFCSLFSDANDIMVAAGLNPQNKIAAQYSQAFSLMNVF